MNQVRLFITASQQQCSEALDLLSDRFGDDGYPVSTMEIDESNDVWEASLYAPAEEQAGLMQDMRQCLESALPDVAIETEHLPDIDWVARSLEGLRPVRAGRFLVHGSHDRDQVRAGDLAIEIDAGRAFGTGHHGTTEGCLEMIGALAKRRRFHNVLDLGTGSGVLAIGIAKLMPASILATDIDPVAIEVATQNARKNGCGSTINWATAAGFHHGLFARHGPFDLIVANILARPLMRMAPALSRNLAADGQVILSGILSEQRRKVLAAYNNQGLFHRRTLWCDGWVTLHLGR
ncbi:50S ribosomal protein L11 methyltransferase [Hoeflea sp.]|uniref:50S ribosomal protein L11 methyltransferase n=1 Tax=Hoeflea sp. TaxID=1940281 RepID=UPI003B0289A7